MATTLDTLQQVDAAIDAIWPQVEAHQADYLAANGRAWQGYRTHETLPADGEKKQPDVGTRGPPDSTPWPPGFRASQQPMGLEVHAYHGPDGPGWVVHIGVTAEGETWHRTIQVGPEDWRDINWHRIDAEFPA